MNQFVKFSDVRKKRIQLARESMSDVKGGAIDNITVAPFCSHDPNNCQYMTARYACPFGFNCQVISLYSVPPGDDPIAIDNTIGSSK